MSDPNNPLPAEWKFLWSFGTYVVVGSAMALALAAALVAAGWDWFREDEGRLFLVLVAGVLTVFAWPGVALAFVFFCVGRALWRLGSPRGGA